MNVVCFAGFSGSGKTTLVEALIALFRQRGLRVSVVKHAHHKFDIDRPGKDSWRHREAGAFEVVLASDKRLALMREFEKPAELSVHHLIAELYDGVDWIFVEGYKYSNLPKIEVWRAATGHDALYPEDPFIAAIATVQPARLPQPTERPVLDLDDAPAVADWLLANEGRFAYNAQQHLPVD